MAALGGVLLHLLWQGALVGIATAIALRLASPAAPRLRYALALGALALIAAAPLATAARRAGMLDNWGMVTPESPTSSASASLPTAIEASPPDAFPPVSDPATSADPLAWLAALWIAGVLLLLGRLAIGLVLVHRLRVRARPAPAALGVGRGVTILVSDRADVPFVTGIRRPAVVLPSGLAATLTAEQIRVVLAHELAHIRRHDYAVNLVQRVLEALFFFHPAVHWISAKARDEREHCCDDQAATVVGDRRAVAGALLALEEARGLPALLPAAGGGRLLQRVERLLAAGPAVRPWWAFAAALVLLMGGATLVLATPATAPSAAAAVVWTGTLRPGERLRARNITGRIRVVRATGTTAVVRATISGELSDLSFQATRQHDGVTLCVLRAALGRCDAEGYTWVGPFGELSRARIELTVELPAGVSVTAATFDGDLQLDGMDADVEARTGSGAIAASILDAPAGRTLDLHTGGGPVRVVLPTAFGGELEARLSNGRIAADPPVGPFESGSHRVRRSLGPGGNRLSVSSGNGDLALTRR